MKLIRAVTFNLLAMLGLSVVLASVLILLKEMYGVQLVEFEYIGVVLGVISVVIVPWFGSAYCYDEWNNK